MDEAPDATADAEVAALLAQGSHAEAALHYFRRGRLLEAQQLYERLWNFGAAAQMARARGDLPDLLRLLLEARELAEAAKVGTLLLDGARPDQERAAAFYERRQMWPEAAVLRERLGQLELAHGLFVKGGQRLEAARLDEVLDRPRQAGQLYERFVQDEPDTVDKAHARLRLARILKRFGKLDEATRHLQRAIAQLCPDGAPAKRELTPLVVELRTELVKVLLGLHLAGAAGHAFVPLQALSPEIAPLEQWPATADESQLLAGRYRLHELIGGGGMGRVYRAVDELSGQAVALKLVARSTTGAASTDDGYRRFVREAQIVAALHHPNIVRLLAVDEALGVLVMELMPGGTLDERLQLTQGGLSLGAVLALALQLAGALEAAHARGVIHRDVKPSNIFFAATGEAKLGDFGVAHLQAFGATQTAGFIGTLAFMSPEQISGAPLSYAADLYGLGVTLFLALTGRLPFAGPDFVSAHLGEVPPIPSSVRPAARPFDALVLRLLAKAPTDRFEELGALRRALMALREQLHDVSATPEIAAEPATEEELPTAPSERYVTSAALGATLHSRLSYATDRVLGRPVILERFDVGYFTQEAGVRHLSWLRSAAQVGRGLQRVLAFERAADGSGQAVFEAIPGTVVRDTEHASIAAACTALRASGWTDLAGELSFVDEGGELTLLLAGAGPNPA